MSYRAVVSRRRESAYTLIELMLGVSVVGVLSVVGVPAYQGHMERIRTANAIADINVISVEIERHLTRTQRLPDALADAGWTGTDPWGQPYQYLRIQGAGLKGKGDLRKDKKLNPLNSDYDLYSKGPDSDSKLPLTAKQSRDDIVRASNGAYIGVAEEY